MTGRVFLWRGLIGTMCNSQGPDPHKNTTNPAVRGVSNFNPTADLQAVQ